MTTLALPPKVRVYVYAILGALSLAVGAAQVGYASVNQPNPDWLTVALAVVPFLAAGLGYTAATHTPAAKTIVEAGQGDVLEVKTDEYVGEHRAPEVYGGSSKVDATFHRGDDA